MSISGSSIFPYEETIDEKPVLYTTEKNTREKINKITNTELLSSEQLEVAEFILEKSDDYGLDSDITLKIAWCESRFRRDAKNPNSTATGVYQFINSTFEHYNREIYGNSHNKSPLNLEDNVILALEIMSRYSVSDWTASSSCHGYT